MGSLRIHRQRSVASRCLAAFLVVGGVVLAASVSAFGAGALVVSQSTGLVQGQSVLVTGSGFAKSAFGYVVECNGTPNEPTVFIGSPFFQSLPVGCSAPSLKHIASTSGTGTLAVTFTVHEGRKLGPPCGINTVLAGCPPGDSANFRPHGDAQNYPCPPSPAQQAAGVTCQLVFFDTAHERVAIPIKFMGAGLPPPPATTVPKTTTTVAKTTTTLPRPTTTLPRVTTTLPQPTTPVRPVSLASGGGTTTPTAPHAVVKASASTLAFTGIGTTGKIVAAIGATLVLFGLLLFFVDVRKTALWLLGL